MGKVVEFNPDLENLKRKIEGLFTQYVEILEDYISTHPEVSREEIMEIALTTIDNAFKKKGFRE